MVLEVDIPGMPEKFTKFLLPISIVIAGVIIAGAFLYLNQGKALSAQVAAEKAISFINENKDTIAGGLTASLIGVSDAGDVYKINIKVGEGEYESFITKDGEFLFPNGYNLKTQNKGEATSTDNTAAGVEKRDRPDVKLFVMSYCPFGLQAQKMFLPVYDLLKDKADMGVYFVNYIMHEKIELDENLRQYCIQKEEKEKYSDYLSCFAASGDYQKCFSQAGIDQGRIENCVFETDKEFKITTLYNDKSTWLNGTFPKFDVQGDLNTKYGVQGSPTIIINDKEVSVSPRSPETFKEIVCQAFNSQPEECSQTLSSDVPSTGIGAGTGSSTDGGCAQ